MRYQSKRTRRQFLAGVTCPECHSTDSVVQIRKFEPVLDEYIECTLCNHIERRPTADSMNKTNDLTTDTPNSHEQGIVRLIDIN